MTSPVDDFVSEATAFERWAKSGTDNGCEAARNALVRLLRLYSAAIELPAHSVTCDELELDSFRVEDAEWEAVLAHSARLGFDYYGSVFDPIPVPAQEACIGSLADDIADIYRDVVTGLRYYHAGHTQDALHHWSFMLLYHWGNHATSAIRALHCWLEQNDPEALGSGPKSGANFRM
jgi:hypothetical protein